MLCMGGQTGAVFYIYYEGTRITHVPILTRKKKFHLSKRKCGPALLQHLSAKADNREKRSIQAGNSLLLSRQFHALSAGSRFLYFCMAAESGKADNSIFPQKAAKSTGSPLPVCGSTARSWKPPVLSGPIPGSRHASQTDMSFVRGGSCRRRPFACVFPWLYVVNLSRMLPPYLFSLELLSEAYALKRKANEDRTG